MKISNIKIGKRYKIKFEGETFTGKCTNFSCGTDLEFKLDDGSKGVFYAKDVKGEIKPLDPKLKAVLKAVVRGYLERAGAGGPEDEKEIFERACKLAEKSDKKSIRILANKVENCACYGDDFL